MTDTVEGTEAEQPAGPGASPVIQLDRVTKRFGDFVAVEEAHFDIREGEFFSMLGPSGCGKTTTLRMIAGFEQPTSGQILLGGTDVSRTPPHRRDVNTVFQQYALFPHMTVFENVAFGLRNSIASVRPSAHNHSMRPAVQCAEARIIASVEKAFHAPTDRRQIFRKHEDIAVRCQHMFGTGIRGV